MTNAVMFQAEKDFVWTKEIIQAIQTLLNKKVKAVEFDEEMLEALQDLQDARRGEELYAEFVASGSKGIPASEVFKELGLE